MVAFAKAKINHTFMKQFSSSDLGLSASLATQGYQMVGGGKMEGSQKLLFFFPDSAKLRNTVEAYYSSQLLIEPQKFMATLKLFKNLIHSYAENR